MTETASDTRLAGHRCPYSWKRDIMKIREMIGKGSEDDGNDPPSGGNPLLFWKAPERNSEEDKRIRRQLTEPEKLNDADDADIKQLYLLIRDESRAEETRRLLFKKIDKRVGKMIKQDKGRSEFRHIRKLGKILAIIGLIMAIVFVIYYRYIPKMWPTGPEELYWFLKLNIEIIQEYMPEVEFGLQIFTVGLILYIAARVAIMIQDQRIKRRIVCKAVSECLDVSDVVRLSIAAYGRSIHDIEDFYPLKELCAEKKG